MSGLCNTYLVVVTVHSIFGLQIICIVSLKTTIVILYGYNDLSEMMSFQMISQNNIVFPLHRVYFLQRLLLVFK